MSNYLNLTNLIDTEIETGEILELLDDSDIIKEYSDRLKEDNDLYYDLDLESKDLITRLTSNDRLFDEVSQRIYEDPEVVLELWDKIFIDNRQELINLIKKHELGN